MIMWVMSDRAIPRSYRMMEGFGVHTFRFVNARGQVALRQVPLEAAARRALAGVGRGAEDSPARTPTSTAATSGRRSRQGDYPGVRARRADPRGGGRVQVRLRPARRRPSSCPRSWCRCGAIGKLTLEPQPGQLLRRDRAGGLPRRRTSCPGSTSPTIRCCRAGCSRTSTRSSRGSGGPNFAEIPINQSGRAGAQQPARRLCTSTRSTTGGPATTPTRWAGLPGAGRGQHGGYVALPGAGRRATRSAGASESFKDHFSQATLFFNSMSPTEKPHMIDAARFELGRVESPGRAAAHGRPVRPDRPRLRRARGGADWRRAAHGSGRRDQRRRG